MDILGDMGASKLSAKVFEKWTTPLSYTSIEHYSYPIWLLEQFNFLIVTLA